MQPEAQGHLGPPGAGRCRKGQEGAGGGQEGLRPPEPPEVGELLTP